jgi:cathepsin A (carboxypeptidase C)
MEGQPGQQGKDRALESRWTWNWYVSFRPKGRNICLKFITLHGSDLIRSHIIIVFVETGNGLTDPEEQYKWYPEMVFNNSHGIKVVDEATYNTMKAAVDPCTTLIAKCNQGDSFFDDFACQSAFLVCNMGLTSPYQMTGLNPYDIRKECEYPPLCYDFSHIQKFLNLESTKKSLGVDEKHSHSWTECNFGINGAFRTDWMKNFAPYVTDLLNAGIPALVYAGDVDFICNYLGNKAWTLKLEWDGKESFNGAEEHSWKDQGLARTAEGLTFLQVYDAGHMVPADQPKIALDMIGNFMNGGAF